MAIPTMYLTHISLNDISTTNSGFPTTYSSTAALTDCTRVALQQSLQETVHNVPRILASTGAVTPTIASSWITMSLFSAVDQYSRRLQFTTTHNRSVIFRPATKSFNKNAKRRFTTIGTRVKRASPMQVFKVKSLISFTK
jgi:hypothetical protein